jgi:hexokinase
LAAAGIVGILQKIGRPGSKNNGTPVPNKVTAVAIDGGLYEHYAQYRAHMHAAIVELLGENAAQSVVIELSKDGSGGISKQNLSPINKSL